MVIRYLDPCGKVMLFINISSRVVLGFAMFFSSQSLLYNTM